VDASFSILIADSLPGSAGAPKSAVSRAPGRRFSDELLAGTPDDLSIDPTLTTPLAPVSFLMAADVVEPLPVLMGTGAAAGVAPAGAPTTAAPTTSLVPTPPTTPQEFAAMGLRSAVVVPPAPQGHTPAPLDAPAPTAAMLGGDVPLDAPPVGSDVSVATPALPTQGMVVVPDGAPAASAPAVPTASTPLAAPAAPASGEPVASSATMSPGVVAPAAVTASAVAAASLGSQTGASQNTIAAAAAPPPPTGEVPAVAAAPTEAPPAPSADLPAAPVSPGEAPPALPQDPATVPAQDAPAARRVVPQAGADIPVSHEAAPREAVATPLAPTAHGTPDTSHSYTYSSASADATPDGAAPLPGAELAYAAAPAATAAPAEAPQVEFAADALAAPDVAPTDGRPAAAAPGASPTPAVVDGTARPEADARVPAAMEPTGEAEQLVPAGSALEPAPATAPLAAESPEPQDTAVPTDAAPAPTTEASGAETAAAARVVQEIAGAEPTEDAAPLAATDAPVVERPASAPVAEAAASGGAVADEPQRVGRKASTTRSTQTSPQGADAPRGGSPHAGIDRTVPEEQTQPWGTEAADATGSQERVPLSGVRRVGPRENASQAAPVARTGVADGMARAVALGVGVRSAQNAAAAPAVAQSDVVTLSPSEAAEELPRLMVRSAQLARSTGEQELRVRLHPPELGEIRVTFRSQDGALRGAIGVEREDVRQWLDTQAPAWRDELADAGIKVERLDVTLLPRGSEDGHAAPWQDGGTGQWTDTQGHREAASEAPLPALPDTLPELGVNRALTTGRLDCWA